VTDKPKSPEHFGQFESDHPVPERTMTPPEAWDSRPKIASARSVDPLAGVARLFPRDPKSPSEFERQRLIERASRDTEPSDLLSDEDKTPAARPFEVRVERDLKELRDDIKFIRRAFDSNAQREIETHELVKSLASRMDRLEGIRAWIPIAISIIALAVSFWNAGRR